jgi:cyclophilin family peptidyl-prolyl cis-trans isomerase
MQQLTWVAICAGGLALLAEPARAVTITLWTNNIVMPENQTFQMPITASDPDGQPLKFGVKVSKKGKVKAAFAPSSNRSLLINVSGVDVTNAAFTGNLVLQLFEDLTPLTTARIIDLVNSNFYNGLLFQRVIKGFVAQGGGATTNLNLESGVTLDDEYSKMLTYDGFGQLALANQASASSSGTHDSNDSQFFISDVDLSIDNTNNSSPQSLNFEQPIFGQLTSGFDVLAKIMSTPVGSNPDTGETSYPLSNVVMNAVSVITSSQDAVLRLTTARKFHGMVTVTVSATNAANEVATQTFQVNVNTNSTSSPPFLGPMPASATVSQNVATSFFLTATNISSKSIFFNILDTSTGSFPTNLFASRDKHTSLVTLCPDVTLTGTVHLRFEALDSTHQPDTQKFTLNVLPRSPTPTMSIVPLKGEIVDSTSTNKTNGSHISVSGTFAFNSQSDQTFSSNDVIALSLGDPNNPFSVVITPGLPGWKLRHGTISGNQRLSTSTQSNATASVVFNVEKKTFAISVQKFDFPSPGLTNDQIQVGVSIGINYGSDLRSWVEISPHTFVPPAPLGSGNH